MDARTPFFVSPVVPSLFFLPVLVYTCILWYSVCVKGSQFAFNRTGALWPNWKESRPLFIRVIAEQGAEPRWNLGTWKCCEFSFCSMFPHIFFLLILRLFYSLSIFLFLCLMPSDGCENISGEISILFPINPSQHFFAGVPTDSKTEIKSTLVSKKNVLIFHFCASYFWNMSYMCDFSFQVFLLNSFVEDRTWKEPSL